MAASGEQQRPPPQQQKQHADDDDDNNDDDDRLLLSVVFLDMDGVLQPFQQETISNNCIKALAYIMQHVPSARLVLSSTWRVQEKYIQMVLDALHQYGNDDNEMSTSCEQPWMGIDFYDITNPNLHSERQHEIYEWLQRHQQRRTRLLQRRENHSGDINDIQQDHDDDDDCSGDFYRPNNKTQENGKCVRAVAAWVALDDEELLEGEVNACHSQFFQGHVVKTDSHVGLTMDDAKKAVELILFQLDKK